MTAADTLTNLVKVNRELVILSQLAGSPCCGYDVIKRIVATYGVYMTQGGLYQRLYELKDEGLVSTTAGSGVKKIYSLTDQGWARYRKLFGEVHESCGEFLKGLTPPSS